MLTGKLLQIASGWGILRETGRRRQHRVDSTIQIWMGLTMGCAKCHTHKYDPISQRDYYSFFAIFNQTEDADRPNDVPKHPFPTVDQRVNIAAPQSRLNLLQAEFAKMSLELEAAETAWEQSAAAASALWTPLSFKTTTADSGANELLPAAGVTGRLRQRSPVR